MSGFFHGCSVPRLLASTLVAEPSPRHPPTPCTYVRVSLYLIICNWKDSLFTACLDCRPHSIAHTMRERTFFFLLYPQSPEQTLIHGSGQWILADSECKAELGAFYSLSKGDFQQNWELRWFTWRLCSTSLLFQSSFGVIIFIKKLLF